MLPDFAEQLERRNTDQKPVIFDQLMFRALTFMLL